MYVSRRAWLHIFGKRQCDGAVERVDCSAHVGFPRRPTRLAPVADFLFPPKAPPRTDAGTAFQDHDASATLKAQVTPRSALAASHHDRVPSISFKNVIDAAASLSPSAQVRRSDRVCCRGESRRPAELPASSSENGTPNTSCSRPNSFAHGSFFAMTGERHPMVHGDGTIRSPVAARAAIALPSADF